MKKTIILLVLLAVGALGCSSRTACPPCPCLDTRQGVVPSGGTTESRASAGPPQGGPANLDPSKPNVLPAPQTEGGRPLMQVLRDRKSERAFRDQKLPLQTLSNLFWAAFGINRKDTGKRTAPSANNWQEIDVYAVTADGVFSYEAVAHALNPVVGQDIRALAGKQGYVAAAPLNVVYVADYAKMAGAAEEKKAAYAAADAAFIAENVYLFCASFGLAVVVRASIDQPELEKAMKLRPDQHVVLAQTVGYPSR